MKKMFTEGSTGLLERSLDAAALRQRVIANNIANVNTPGFKKSDVVFEDLLRQEMADKLEVRQVRTHAKHLNIYGSGMDIEPRIVTSTATAVRNDGNNVDIDAEMAQTAQNTIYYNTLAQQFSAKLREFKTVINQGGR